jgi:O-antigen/teichoic acid export membrane protein
MGAIQGQVVAQVTGGIIGLIVFYVKIFRNTKKEAITKTDIICTLKTLLKYGLPVSLSVIVAGFLPQFFNILLTQSFTTANTANYTFALGDYQAAVNFTVLIIFFYDAHYNRAVSGIFKD